MILNMQINLGCGKAKISSAVNVDCEISVSPDRICDFKTEKLPFDTGSVETVYLFHTIEHIEKKYHPHIFSEVNRVLKSGGVFMLSYPEFAKILANWLNNHRGMREFWEATIYGRQLYPSDYHVAAMDSDYVKDMLSRFGFKDFIFNPEPKEDYNTVVICKQCEPQVTYEQLLHETIWKSS